MNWLYSIILGLVQGLTEFLPVSSSGHLVLFETLFGLNGPESEGLFFDVLLHVGTLVSILVFYRKDIAEMISEFFLWIRDLFGKEGKRQRDVPPARRLVFLIIVATVPLFLVLPFKGWLEGVRQMPWLVGVALLVTGVLLFASDRLAKGKKREKSTTWLDALIIGLSQSIAVIPGLSRSGTTISTGIFRGLDRKFAVRFSFLMSLPAVIAAALTETIDAVQTGIDWSMLPVYLAGMAVAAVSGFFAIKLVRYIADRGRFGWFAFYCWAAGATTIIVSIVTAASAA